MFLYLSKQKKKFFVKIIFISFIFPSDKVYDSQIKAISGFCRLMSVVGGDCTNIRWGFRSSSSELCVGASIITMGFSCITCHVSNYQIYCDVDNEPLNELFNKLPFHFILRKIFLSVDHVNM